MFTVFDPFSMEATRGDIYSVWGKTHAYKCRQLTAGRGSDNMCLLSLRLALRQFETVSFM